MIYRLVFIGSGVASGWQGGQSAPPPDKIMTGKSGRQRENREGKGKKRERRKEGKEEKKERERRK